MFPLSCFHVRKQKTNCLRHKFCKLKLFGGAILHGMSNEPQAYLEPSQTSMREYFCENG